MMGQRVQAKTNPMRHVELPLEKDSQEGRRPPAIEPIVADPAGVVVISGANQQHLPLVGLLVSEVGLQLQPLMSIRPNAPIVVNGQPIESDYRLKNGDVLEFVHHAGEKGADCEPAPTHFR